MMCVSFCSAFPEAMIMVTTSNGELAGADVGNGLDQGLPSSCRLTCGLDLSNCFVLSTTTSPRFMAPSSWLTAMLPAEHCCKT